MSKVTARNTYINISDLNESISTIINDKADKYYDRRNLLQKEIIGSMIEEGKFNTKKKILY